MDASREANDTFLGAINGNGICIAVDDIRDIWSRIVDTGAPQDDAPKQGADFNWQCWMHDPDGNKIELMQLDEKSPQMEFIKSMS